MALDPKKVISDLQAVIDQRGPSDPLSQLAARLQKAAQDNPEASSSPGYLEGLRRFDNAMSQVSGGGDPIALAKDAEDAVRTGVAEAGGVPSSPEEAEAKKLKDAETVRSENQAKWEELAGLPLDELKGKFGLSDWDAQNAHDRFVEAVNGYVDPTFEAALPDLVSAAEGVYASPEDVAKQQEAFDKAGGAYSAAGEAFKKAEGLSGIEETAEEKFMREQARRTQERDLRSQRDADKNSLLARGAYGSGAEIAMNGQAQQEAAERRSLEEMNAGANAQKRALEAIGQMGTISGQMGAIAGEQGAIGGKMREQSDQEAQYRATGADAVRKGNRDYTEKYNEWKRGQQVEDERGKVERATLTKNDADASRAERDKRTAAIWGAEADTTAGATGQYSKDSAPVAGAFGSNGSLAFNREVQDDLTAKDDGLFGIF